MQRVQGNQQPLLPREKQPHLPLEKQFLHQQVKFLHLPLEKYLLPLEKCLPPPPEKCLHLPLVKLPLLLLVRLLLLPVRLLLLRVKLPLLLQARAQQVKLLLHRLERCLLKNDAAAKSIQIKSSYNFTIIFFFYHIRKSTLLFE
jgi:hypothetical protein